MAMDPYDPIGHWLAIEGIQPKIVENPTAQELSVAAAAGAATTQPSTTGQPEAAAAGADKPKELVKDVLTKELQVYYEKITESLMSGEEEMSTLAISSVHQDPGIQALLPYFLQFMTDKITRHMKELPVMWTMMRLARSLLHNPHLFVEPYLHSLMPNIITCIVGKR
jgi:transcription initiation factor TFIID subunit 6